MRLIPLEIGHIDRSMGAITGNDETRTFPVPSWLTEHPHCLALCRLLFGLDQAPCEALPSEGLA